LYKSIIATKLAEYLGLSQAVRAITYVATLLRAGGLHRNIARVRAVSGGADDVAVRLGGDAIDTDDLDLTHPGVVRCPRSQRRFVRCGLSPVLRTSVLSPVSGLVLSTIMTFQRRSAMQHGAHLVDID
jgi:hypothetical protein